MRPLFLSQFKNPYMHKFLLFVLFAGISLSTFAQTGLYKKKPTFSVNFLLNDFRTADRLRTSTVESVLNQKKWSQIKEMSPGLSLNYFQGLSDHVDFMATLGGSFADVTPKNQETTNKSNVFLLELDANVNLKLLSDRYAVNPYLTAGVGASMYKSSYGAYIPFGVGVQFKLTPESFLFLNSQYRVGITDKASNHFVYSIGFGAPLVSTK